MDLDIQITVSFGFEYVVVQKTKKKNSWTRVFFLEKKIRSEAKVRRKIIFDTLNIIEQAQATGTSWSFV